MIAWINLQGRKNDQIDRAHGWNDVKIGVTPCFDRFSLSAYNLPTIEVERCSGYVKNPLILLARPEGFEPLTL